MSRAAPFVERPDVKRSHTIVIATEDVAAGVFHETIASRFPLEPADLSAFGEPTYGVG
jgi:hypothetical protein